MTERKIAVLIDSDNTPWGKLPLIVEELSAFGQIVVKRAYGDFSSEYLKNWKQPLNELAIQPEQQSWQKCRDEAGWANLNEAGSYIKRIKPDFDPRTYGLGKLSDFFDDYRDRYETNMSGTGIFKFKLISKTDAKIMRQSK